MTTPARRLALDVFAAVLDRRRFLDDALADHADAFQALAPRDRGFLRRLVLTAFRRLGEIDAVIDARLERPLPDAALPIRHILRLALAEIRHLEGAPHAAVDSAVTAAKQADRRFSGLVNAILRGVLRAPPPMLDADAAAKANTPDWLWERLVEDYGRADAAAIARAQLEPAPLDLTPKDPADKERLAAELGARATPTGTLRLERGDPSALPGYKEGRWWVQDAAAALPATLLDLRAGERALDLCAAPGGKTLQLAAKGADVTALDISEWRLKRVAENLARANLSAAVVTADARAWRPEQPFHAVLLDAPCSATGTIRRHPEALRIKRSTGLENLTALQDQLLDAAWEMTAPGGRLVFCTCSLFKAEGETRIAAFLERHPAARLARLSEATASSGLKAFIGDPPTALRTAPSDWADLGGLDGFFVARLEKPAET